MVTVLLACAALILVLLSIIVVLFVRKGRGNKRTKSFEMTPIQKPSDQMEGFGNGRVDVN